ncbi:MAG: FHA domain-containing protein, partial [Chloroflexota bacterium]
LTIGRSQDNDVVLEQQGISRRHARVEQTAGGWQIVDLGSTNGTFLEGNKLLPDVPETWEAGQTLHIGAYYLQWRVAGEEDKRLSRATTGVQPGSGDAPSGATQMYSRISHLNVVLNPTQLTVVPGEEEALQAQLANDGVQVAHYRLRLQGLPEGWVSIPRETVRLMPGDETTLTVRIHPPRQSNARAGRHAFQVHVSANEETGDVVIEGVLNLSLFSALSVDVHPTHLNHGDRTRVEIHNEGNSETVITLRGRDPAGEIRFDGAHELRVPPGETESSELTVVAAQRPWLGRKVTRPFHIEVTAGEQRYTEPGQLDVPPRLPTFLALLVLPLLCLATGAFAFWVIGPQFGLGSDNNGGRSPIAGPGEETTAAPPAATTPPTVTATASDATPVVVGAATLTPTATPTGTPTPTRNPGIGRFETSFSDEDTVMVAFGPTLGGQHVCAYHNLSLGEQDVGKTLTFRADDIAVNPPGDSVLIDVVSATLYRSLIGAVDGADEDVFLDLWDQPNVEEVVEPASPFAGIEWEVTQSGDYILCLQVAFNTFLAEDGSFDGAVYTTLLSGG